MKERTILTMGKSSNKYPGYAKGSVTVNGRTVATSDKGNTSYNMSDAEQKMYNLIQSKMNSSLKNLFKITNPQRQEWTNQLNAMKQKGIDQINSIYNPMEKNLRNNVANRFGNLDNSVFLDNLNNITNKKANAIGELGSQLALQQNSLYNNELSNRINTLSFLGNMNNAFNNNIQNYLNLASSNSAAANSYNNTAYNNRGSNWYDFYQNPNFWSSAIGLFGI